MYASLSCAELYAVAAGVRSALFRTQFFVPTDMLRFVLQLGQDDRTVNVGSETSRHKMARWIEEWEVE
jgi:hypothetical protein